MVIETGDSDAEILVMEPGEKFGENRERVRHSAAVDAGVQVALRAGQLDWCSSVRVNVGWRGRLCRAWKYPKTMSASAFSFSLFF